MKTSKHTKLIDKFATFRLISNIYFIGFFILAIGATAGVILMHDSAAQKTDSLKTVASESSNSTTLCVVGQKGCTDKLAPVFPSSTSSTPAPSTPTTPAASSPSDSQPTSTPTVAPVYVPPIKLPSNQQICAQGAAANGYTYDEAVDSLASLLAQDEDTAAQIGNYEISNLPGVIYTINQDISSTNSAISSDWTGAFVTNVPADCAAYPYTSSAPLLLQVPDCDITSYGGVAGCIEQIDTSLGID